MHPFKDKAKDSRTAGRKCYADGGGVLKDLTNMGLFGIAGKGLVDTLTGSEKDQNAPNFVPKKSGGKVKKKGC